MRKNLHRFIVLIIVLLSISVFQLSATAESTLEEVPPDDRNFEIEVVNPSLAIVRITLHDGTEFTGHRINGPPEPPPEFNEEREASILPLPSRGVIASFPSYDWVFGCSAVSGAMIAGYYDNDSYTNMYAGPTNGGVMPLTDTSWSTWWDSEPHEYPNNPLVASHYDVDGRPDLGSIDNYWVQYDSTADDPYITYGWPEHAWGSAIGDYMKTSQSAFSNTDGSTQFFFHTIGTKTTCAIMEGGVDDLDGTYGRKMFYEARGYTVTDCYNQLTDNQHPSGFTLAEFQAEIDAGHPVLLNLEGHSIVGYGYDGSTIYIRDTWDNNPGNIYTMEWGGSYAGMPLQMVSIVNLEPISVVDPYEPDDTPGEANWISDGSPQTHSIVPVGDEDWVVFELFSESGITLETSGPSGDTRMWLYDSGLTEIEYNDDAIGGWSYIDRVCGVDALPAGTYYVKVDEFGARYEIPSYDITLNVSPCGEDSYEPDDSPGEANWIFDGSSQTHSIMPVGDEDWVKFDLASESGITLETSGPSGDTGMTLYDSGLSELEYNDDGGSGTFSYIDRVCESDPLSAGTYYVKIDEFADNEEILSYNISLNISPCGTTQHNIYLPLVMVD